MIKIEATSINVCKALLVLIDYNVKARISSAAITLEGDIKPSMIRKLELDILSVKKYDGGSFPLKKFDEESEYKAEGGLSEKSASSSYNSVQDKSLPSKLITSDTGIAASSDIVASKTKEDALYIPPLEETQLLLLKGVNKSELLQICNKQMYNGDKVRRILEIFGFDMKKTGMNYLSLAIFRSIVLPEMTLADLCKEVVKIRHDVSATEVERVIVSRIKENFQLKKSPAGSFIRLVKYLILSKGGVLNAIS